MCRSRDMRSLRALAISGVLAIVCSGCSGFGGDALRLPEPEGVEAGVPEPDCGADVGPVPSEAMVAVDARDAEAAPQDALTEIQDAATDAVLDAGGEAPASEPGCAPGTGAPYVVSTDGRLFRFDPRTLEFEIIGWLSDGVIPNSMAIDRAGTAWITGRTAGSSRSIRPPRERPRCRSSHPCPEATSGSAWGTLATLQTAMRRSMLRVPQRSVGSIRQDPRSPTWRPGCKGSPAREPAAVYAEEVVPGFALHGMGGEAQRYIATTLERFQNPFLDHRLADIAQNHAAKLRNRVAEFIVWARQRDPGFTAPRLSEMLTA